MTTTAPGTPTRADLLADGSLREVPASIYVHWFDAPLALTREVWARAVTWTRADTRRTGLSLTEWDRLVTVVHAAVHRLVQEVWDAASDSADLTRPRSLDFTAEVIDPADVRTDDEGRVIVPRVAFTVVLDTDADGDPCLTVTLPAR